MAIDLSEIPVAVRTYLDTKVIVRVQDFQPGTGGLIDPNEIFTFRIIVSNALRGQGGVKVSNVIYSIRVVNSDIAKIRVPSVPRGRVTTPAGGPLTPGEEVASFILDPAPDTDHDNLATGDSVILALTGRTGPGAGGRTTRIECSISANIDQTALFPRGGPVGSGILTVEG